MKINKNVICSSCNGTGSSDPSVTDTKCRGCNGMGRKMKAIRQGNTIYQTQQVCDSCEGKKFVIPEGQKCETCNGGKVTKESKLLSIEIEKGMQWGQQLAYYGEADQFPDTITGDVIFQLRQKKDELSDVFEREGHDLVTKQDVSLGDALCGAKLVIKHLDGRELVLSVPNGEIVQPGEKRKISGQGMPILNKPEQFGDLYVVLAVSMPKSLDQKQVNQIKAIFPPKKLVFNETTAHRLPMTKLTERERKQAERNSNRMDEDGEGGHGQGGVQCAQQ